VTDAQKLKAFEDWMDLSGFRKQLVQTIARVGGDAPDARARLGEFVDPDAAIWGGDAGLPQPMAPITGGPYDGEQVANDRDFFCRPDPAPLEFSWDTIKSPEETVTMRRYNYLRKPVRPCPDAAAVATFVLS
jgi:hypothetical protein